MVFFFWWFKNDLRDKKELVEFLRNFKVDFFLWLGICKK